MEYKDLDLPNWEISKLYIKYGFTDGVYIPVIINDNLIGFICMSNVPIGRTILVFVWVFHVLYFIFGIKTIEEQTEEL